MQIIPIAATPSQKLTILLGGQNCQIKVYQKTTGVYLDLAVNDSPIVSGVVCRDRVAIVRDTYLGFTGDLSFFDTQGTSDPSYTGFGARFQLVYLEASDLS
jgi:hypothetical protein